MYETFDSFRGYQTIGQMEFAYGFQIRFCIVVRLYYGLPYYLVVAQCVFSEPVYKIDKVVTSRKV